jgi:hypothetical protein
MLLRPGNAGSNTVTDHIRVLGDAIAQIPVAYRRKSWFGSTGPAPPTTYSSIWNR